MNLFSYLYIGVLALDICFRELLTQMLTDVNLYIFGILLSVLLRSPLPIEILLMWTGITILQVGWDFYRGDLES